MPERSERVSLKTPRARLSFPSLFKMRQMDEDSTPRYECQLIFAAADANSARIQALKEACAKVAAEKWGQKRPANLRSPFRKCEEKPDLKGYEEPGSIFVTTSTHRRPHCLLPGGGAAGEDDLYAGCYVVALVSPYAYENKGNRGVALGLDAIYKVADGEELSGGGVSIQSAKDAFADEVVEDFAPASPASDAPRGGLKGDARPDLLAGGMGIADDDIPF